MLRQQHHGEDFKRPLRAYRGNRFVQARPRLLRFEEPPPPVRHHREEECPAGNVMPQVIRHGSPRLWAFGAVWLTGVRCTPYGSATENGLRAGGICGEMGER
jgi:hypothetical protein